MTQMRMPQIKR